MRGEEASGWAARHAGKGEQGLLIGRLEKSEFKRLVKEGKITIEKIEGLPVPQVRFQPEHFDEFNELIKWGEIIEL